MRKFVAASAAALTLAVSAAANAAVFYEPFDYPVGNLGLNVNPSVNQTWYSSAVGTGTDDRVQVSDGNLSYSGLPDSAGRMATFGGSGRTDRIFLGSNRTTGSVYYSLLMKVSDLAGTTAGGATIFGFNNTAQTAANHDTAAQPTTISGRLIVRPLASDPTNSYEIGIHKSAGTTAQFVFASTPFTLNDTVYLVGRYTFNTGTTTDDTFDLWINPAGSTFADDSLMPVPTLTESAGSDTNSIATIILRQTSAIVPAGLQFDEIRVDTSWAQVTSNLVPEPASAAMLCVAATATGLIRRRRGRAAQHRQSRGLLG
jgi:hypothetical protein